MANANILKLKVDSAEYDSKIKRASQGLLHLGDSLKKAGKSFLDADKDQIAFVRELGKMDTVSKTAKGRIGEMSKAFTDLRMQYKQMTDAEKNSPIGKAMNQSLNELKGRIQDTKRQLADVDKELNVAKVDTTDFSGVLSELGGKLGVSSELMGVLTTGTMGYAAAIGVSMTAVIAATKAWVEYNSELAKQSQITSVTTGLSGGDAGAMTDFARSVASTYGVDFREVINAANILMQQFGKSGQEAMQLIRDGMQGMIQGDGPKLLSMIQQYAPSFRDAGISASQLVAIIQNSEGGIFTAENMNAIVMGIKNIRLMTNSTAEALQKVGIDSEEMTRKLNDGSITIFDAMRQVSEAIEKTGTSSQAAGEVMQQVFGRQGTAAGTNLGKAIANLNTNLDETKKQTGSLGEEFAKLQKSSEDLENALRECFGFKEIDDLEAKLKTTFYNALTKVIDGVIQLKGVWQEFEDLVGRNVVANAFKVIAARIAQMLHPMMLVYDQAVKLFMLFGSDNGRGSGWYGKASGALSSTVDQMVLSANGNFGGGRGGYVAPVGGGGGGGGKKGGGGRGGGSTNTPKYVPVEGSIDYQAALVADLQKQWKAAADDDSRARIKAQIDATNKELDRMQGKVEDIDLSKIFPEGSMSTGDDRTFAQKMMDGIISDMATAAADADTNTMKTLMSTIIENGLEGLNIDWESISEQMWEGMNIPDDKWQELVDEINEKLAELDIKPIEIDFKTGQVKKQAKEMKTDWQAAASAIQSVGSAMSQIEDPAAKVLGTIAQAIATIAQGFAIATSKEANKGVWNWIAAIAAGTATMLSTIATIKSVTKGGFAEGGIVPGNNMSGDNLPLSDYGINSGELILSRAQQSNLASQLTGSGIENLRLSATITGEQIRLALNNNGKRTGRGEYITSNFMR